MPATAAGWTALAAVATVGVVTYSAVESRSEQKEAKSEAKKQRFQQQEQLRRELGRELEAGEYFEELTRKQMELQAQSSNIKTLAALIEQQSQPAARQILTLPAATETSAVDQINQAIGKLFGG